MTFSTMDHQDRWEREREIDRDHERKLCEWYLHCSNTAIDTVDHPVLGLVPICGACKDKL